LGGCGPDQNQAIEIEGPTMGTYFSVKVPRPPPDMDVQQLRRGIERVLIEVNREISTYDPDSELSRLNRNPSTDWIPVSRNLLAAIAEGQRVGALSGGAFDITVGPLVNLWGFGPDPDVQTVPSPGAIAAARARVGYDKIELRTDPPAIRKQRGDIYIDLSALGEGYGADRLAAFLESAGIGDYLAAIAGTMRLRGRNAKGEPWGIAIERPASGRRTVQGILPLTDGAISTSGDYRNYFEQAGRRYSHHIDPRSGQPVSHRLASATVALSLTADCAMRADGLATALVVLGEQKGPVVAESGGIAAYFIVRGDQGLREMATTAYRRLSPP
jgi:thiamine biosynthesis lipoprotein